MVRNGGGFFFDLLHCDACGESKGISHESLGDIHLRFIKGLLRPYAVARAAMNERIRQEFQGEPLDRVGYHEAAELTLEPCACGGHFRYDAPARCPKCRSTSENWVRDRAARGMHYD